MVGQQQRGPLCRQTDCRMRKKNRSQATLSVFFPPKLSMQKWFSGECVEDKNLVEHIKNGENYFIDKSMYLSNLDNICNTEYIFLNKLLEL